MIQWMWGYIKRIWSAVKAARKTSFRKRLVAMLAAIVLVVTTVGMVRPARTASSEDAAVQQTAGDTVQAEAGENADQTTGVVQTAAEENADTAAQTMPAGTFQAQTATSVQAGDDTAKSVVTNAEVSYDADTFQSGSSFSMKFIDKDSSDTTVSAQAESDQALIDEALAANGEQTAACYPYALTFLDADGNETEPAASVNVKLTFADLPKTNANAQWAVFHITTTSDGQWAAVNLADETNEAHRPHVTQNENGALTDVSFTAERFSDYVIAEVEAIPTATPVPTATTAPTATAVPTATPTLTAAPTATAAASAKEAESAATSPSTKSSEADSEAASSEKTGTASAADAAESSKTTATPTASANSTASSDAATATPTGSAKGAASSDAATATPTKSASSTDSSITPTPTVATTSPARVMRRAPAVEKTQNITGNLTDASIKINGQEVSDSTWNVKDGSSYEITLTFKENSSSQFPNDNTWMTYKIPEGLTVGNFSTTFDMVVDGKTISGNKLFVDKESGLIKIQWNTSDANFKALTEANNAYVNVKLNGSFDKDIKEIKFSDLITRKVNVDTKHNASVDKTGYYDSKDGKIHYTVTVTSSGTSKDVVVTDDINGTALTYDDNVAYTSTKGATATMKKKGNGFTAKIPSMSDGEQVKFTYTASVDFDKLKESGTVEQAETSNGVTITCPGDNNKDDNSKTQYVNDISFSSIGKNAQSVSDTYMEKGKTYRNITWNLTANNERKKHLTYISDSINPDSQSIMTYSGDGLTIVVTKEDGTTVTRTVKWDGSSNSSSNGSITKTTTGWTYMPPESDGKASYNVTYTTKADVTNLITSKNVSNGAKTDYNSTTGNTSVGPSKENEFSASKEVTRLSKEKTTWMITINVPAKGCDKLVVTDTLPSKWISNVYYSDSFDKIQSVDGLDNSESYTVDKQGTGSNGDPFRFILTFYKDKNKTQPGMNSSTGNRTITIRYTTKNNETWMKDTTDNPYNSDLWQHHNEAVVNASDVSMKISADANYNPSVQTVKKTGNLSGQYTDSNGVIWQILAYDITLGGVPSDDQKITDTFNTSYLKYFNGVQNQYYTDSSAGTIYGSDNNPDYPSEGTTKIPEKDIKDIEGGIEFDIGKFPRKSDGTLYKAYRIHYYLKVKVSDMQQLAIESGGTAKFENKAKWGAEDDTVDIYYPYPGVKKTCEPKTVYDSNGKIVDTYYLYKIEVNPNALAMNGGNAMQLVDTFTNQVIDSSTVTISATDQNGKDRSKDVIYDFSGNTGTFTIPDSTHVIIQYQAKPNGKVGDTVTMTNKAEMLTYHSETSNTVTIGGNASGGASTVSLRLMKYAKGNQQKKLSGAVFQLFDADGNALQYDLGDKKGQKITFTTGSNGYVDIKLSASTEYSKGLEYGKTYKLKEITAPVGYQLADEYIPFAISDNGTVDATQNLYANGSTITVADKKITNVKVTLTKVDSGNTKKTLSGAVFDLYGSDYVGSDGNVNTSATAVSTNLTTGSDGTVVLGTLTDGTYYLVETTAPSGYVAEEKPIKLTVTDEKVTVVQGTDTRSSDITDGTSGQTATITVTDSAGYVLPSTGGIGTIPFYVIGGILAIGAVIALIVRAKMREK